MKSLEQVEPSKYNISLAEALKKLKGFKAPEWVDFVKTGANKQRPSVDPDFWYKRAASILRQIYIHEIVGVQRLRTRYGGNKNRGAKPPEFRKSGGNIIRKILQQAESEGLLEKAEGKKKGRKLTLEGKRLLDEIAGELK